MAATVDPGLRVEGVEGVVEAWDNGQKLMRLDRRRRSSR